MKIGMLWFDDDGKRTLVEKVLRAASYYEKKYRAAPSVCYVHPSTLEAESIDRAEGIALRAEPRVHPNHFWIGVSDTNNSQSSDRHAA